MSNLKLYCPICNNVLEDSYSVCPVCGAPLEVYHRRAWLVEKHIPSIWRYTGLLPKPGKLVTFNEGLTPLSRIMGVLVKDETRNPSRSYIDRGSSVLASVASFPQKAVLQYKHDITVSLTAYLQNRGVEVVVVVEGDEGGYLELIEISRLGASITFTPQTPTISYAHPLMIEGFKTIAYEIHEQAPNIRCIAVPMEEGVLAYSIIRGFQILEELQVLSETPTIIAVALGQRMQPRLYPLLLKFKRVKIESVGEREVLDAMVKLSRRGLYPRPIALTSYTLAMKYNDCMAIITGSELKKGVSSRLGRAGGSHKLTDAQREILKVLEDNMEGLTAYTIWKLLGKKYTLRGVYSILETLARKGHVKAYPTLKGSKKVKIYSLTR